MSQDLPRILVVDDDRDTRQLMARILRQLGEVVEAEDGEEALEVMLDVRPDLVVTDVMMRRLDGFELTRTLKGDPTLKQIPVVVVTAKHLPRDVIKGIQVGARSYIFKPFTPKELLEKARRALGRRGRPR